MVGSKWWKRKSTVSYFETLEDFEKKSLALYGFAHDKSLVDPAVYISLSSSFIRPRYGCYYIEIRKGVYYPNSKRKNEKVLGE